MRKLLGFGLVIAAACSYRAQLADYCAASGSCACTAAECCVNEGFSCDDAASCCEGRCLLGKCRRTLGSGGGGSDSSDSGTDAGGSGGGTGGGSGGGSGGGGTGIGGGGGSMGGGSGGGGGIVSIDGGGSIGDDGGYYLPDGGPLTCTNPKVPTTLGACCTPSSSACDFSTSGPYCALPGQACGSLPCCVDFCSSMSLRSLGGSSVPHVGGAGGGRLCSCVESGSCLDLGGGALTCADAGYVCPSPAPQWP